jgi:phosphate transport system substrate-binding protein
MTIKSFIFSLMIVTAVASLLPSCNKGKKAATVSGMSKVMCDESFKNVLDDEIEVFEYSYKDASVLARYIDEAAALDSLLNEKVNVIITYRDLTPNQKKILKGQGRAYRSRRIAVDGVALIVNNANDIDFLSVNDIADIMTGKSTKWGQVYPTKLKDEPIKVVFDKNRSGVLHYMKDKFNGGKDLPIEFFAQGSSQEVFDIVKKTRNAIGVIGVSWITSDMKSTASTIEEKYAELESGTTSRQETKFTDEIKVLGIRTEDSLKDYKPYQAYIFDGSYPLTREIFAIDASPLGTLDHDFFVFLTGSIGQKIILQTGISPAAVPVRIVNLVDNE